MNEFLASSKGNTLIGIALTVLFFAFLNLTIGLGGFIGGAIAGAVGFAAAAGISSVAKKKLKNNEDSNR